MDNKELFKKIVSKIEELAEEYGIHPYKVTQAQILRDGAITEWQIRKFNGLTAIKDLAFENPGLDPIAKSEVMAKKRYMRKLERSLGDRDYFIDTITKRIKSVLKDHPIPVSPNIKKPKRKKTVVQREIVAFMSDTHFGLTIDPDEVPSNKYGWKVAARRMGKFAQQIATYKIEHRAETPTLRLCLGGDLAQGVIHMDEAGLDLMTYQFVGTISIIKQMLDYLRHHFDNIIVECTPCNHLRFPWKNKGGRVTSQKFDSFATMIYVALQEAFRTAKDVEFHVPKTPWTDFEILGHRIYMTHGDTTFTVGNPGQTINTKNITQDVDKLNAAVPDSHKKYEAVMLGHVHKALWITLDNGVEFLTNGTGSGTDPFAQGGPGVFTSHPAQCIFEVTVDHVIGDYRRISLKDADDNIEFEKIIKPYGYTLEVEKLSQFKLK